MTFPIPDISLYMLLSDCTPLQSKTPKYKLTKHIGYYPPIEQLANKEGDVIFYLIQKLEGAKQNTPAMRLQAKNSLNFSGLKNIFKSNKITSYAYGYPLSTATFGKDNKPNPFFCNKDDGYLFVLHFNEDEDKPLKPTAIEVLILDNAKLMITAFASMLAKGGFEESLQICRQKAKETERYNVR